MSKLRTSQAFKSARLSVATVERIDTQRHRSTSGYHFIATINPIAIIVSVENEQYALNMTGQPADLHRLQRELSDADDYAS